MGRGCHLLDKPDPGAEEVKREDRRPVPSGWVAPSPLMHVSITCIIILIPGFHPPGTPKAKCVHVP